ncbi:TPA: integrase family protein [Citrobacter braakii]|uniref:tyrosine-type recombinase/integrase n=1 Tax=unclassified Citrobacter TaxID=2644389 RepID=UPI0015EAC44C|nr:MULTISPECIES: tyrosine-type recombinase/integrase [unclassified Citrobacter]HEE0057394.1 integrase family protein [Citrobacter braakii]QLS34212.1 integrase family protein [Citrobacter sp. RHBSTW-00903]QLV35313.1 integrase family protein [Citrobacter sp. RHBSTW-00424]HEE9862736.1 integrase family protein [Citrobacter braakii]HEE9970041.1 integrase family protein [Citrobacter braakii]
MKAPKKITKQSQVDALTLPADKNVMRISVLNGALTGLSLVLRRTSSGGVTGSYITRRDGKDISIGPRTSWTLAAAQERHREIMTNMTRGIDARTEAITVPHDLNALFRAYINNPAFAPADSTVKTYVCTWQKYCNRLSAYGETTIENFTRASAHSLIRTVAEKHSVNSAKKLRDILLALRHYLESQFDIEAFETLMTLQKLLGKNNTELERSRQPRTNYLEKDQLRALWRYLCEDETRPAHLAARMLICAPLRKGEVVGGRWEEVDEDAGLWRIPGSRTKTGFPLNVPISPAMEEIFEAARRCVDGGFIFGISSSAINHRLPEMRAACGNAEMTVHDLRRTASQLSASDELNEPGSGLTFIEADLILNHVKGAKSQASAIATTYQPETLQKMVTDAIAKYQNWLEKEIIDTP